jgi:hypothetical protein
VDDLVAELDRLFRSSRVVPATGDVRVVGRTARKLADSLHAGAAEFADGEAAYELERLLREGRPVPLTGQIRVDEDDALALIERLRGSGAGE